MIRRQHKRERDGCALGDVRDAVVVEGGPWKMHGA